MQVADDYGDRTWRKKFDAEKLKAAAEQEAKDNEVSLGNTAEKMIRSVLDSSLLAPVKESLEVRCVVIQSLFTRVDPTFPIQPPCVSNIECTPLCKSSDTVVSLNTQHGLLVPECFADKFGWDATGLQPLFDAATEKFGGFAASMLVIGAPWILLLCVYMLFCTGKPDDTGIADLTQFFHLQFTGIF